MKKILLLMALLTLPVSAMAVTPNEVYNVVDKIHSELDILLDADFVKDPPKERNLNIAPRKPKHVVQKAREAYTRLGELQKLNGQQQAKLPPIPMVNITPGDVKNMVDRILAATQSARKSIGLEKPSYPGVPSGKNPTDVYRHLALSVEKINRLGIPSVVPNDVYRVALQISQDIETLRKHAGVQTSVADVKAKKKSPTDAYNATYQFLEGLKESGLKGTNGIVMTSRKRQGITPSDVLDLQGNILAELHTVKVAYGIRKPATFPPAQIGKTPADVYNIIKKSSLLLNTLKE